MLPRGLSQCVGPGVLGLSLSKTSSGAFLAFELPRWVTASGGSCDGLPCEAGFDRVKFAKSTRYLGDWAVGSKNLYALGANSLRRAAIAMMQTADLVDGDHLTVFRWLNVSRDGRIALKRKMSA